MLPTEFCEALLSSLSKIQATLERLEMVADYQALALDVALEKLSRRK